MKLNTIKDITDFIFIGKRIEDLTHYDLLIINADWAEEGLAKGMKLMLDKNIIDNDTDFIICESHGNTDRSSAKILIDYLKKEGFTNKIIIDDKYISKEEWLSDEIINTFNPNDNELVGLIVEYDNKVLKKGTFNPNNVLQFLFNSIKIKINNNEKIDTEKLMELLKQYCNYYYDIDRELDASIGIDLAEILDSLGTYRHKISR